MPTAQGLPTFTPDSSAVQVPNRADNYGGALTSPLSASEMLAAAEGSYFVAVSPTPGTGIIGHAAPTTYDETKPYLFVYNGHATKTLYPKILHLHDTVVSVGGARVQFTISTDSGNLRTSGGTAMTIANTNQGSSNSGSDIVIYQGAVVSAAGTAAKRLLGNYCFRGTIDVVEDDYQLVFGGSDGVGPNASRPTTVIDASRSVPPIGIAPGKCMHIVQWAASQSTGPTFEAVFGFVLR